MLVTLEGMTISDRESQPENAQSPMLVTLEGMTISDRERQFYIASDVYSPPGYSAFARLP